ncbi:organomercurial lyase [Corynebacterium deserti]
MRSLFNKQGDRIRIAQLFTAAPKAFVLTLTDGFDDRHWWGGYAWDSFGISATTKTELRIETACPECGEYI